MHISKLVVQGSSYQRTLEFSKNLNLISGEKTSGKSLVLSLIDYCLGKKSIVLKVQVELNQHADKVFLEIILNGVVYTIMRGLQRDVSNFYVYYTDFLSINDFMPEKMNSKELQSFLMEKIGTMEFKKRKNKQRSEELTTETISFRDLFRYCYIHQHDLGTHNFLANNEYMKRYKNPIAFEMIFSLVDYSQNDVQTEIVEVQNSITQHEKRKENLGGYLEQRNNANLLDLLDQIESYEKQIIKLTERKYYVLNQQKGTNELVEANSSFVMLSDEIRLVDAELDKLKREIKEICRGIDSNNFLLKDYDKEKKDIQATEEINYKLKISEHHLSCPLCYSKIYNKFENEDKMLDTKKTFTNLLKDIDKKIAMVEKIIRTSEENIEELSNKKEKYARRKRILILALEEFAKDVKTPYLPELNSINVNISNLEREKEILLESKRVHKKIDEIDKKIDDVSVRLSSLKVKLREIEDNQSNKSEILSMLNKSYLENMMLMKYSDLSDTYIDSKNYIPYYKGASVFEHESGGLLECMQIAYLESIISSEKALYHPGILMLDSISKYFGTHISELTETIDDKDVIKDPEVYQNIFNMLVNLSKKAQIIVVENTPPDEMLQYEKYSFRNGARGFIDLDKNEFLRES